jgi:hypothetical protein
MLNPLVETYPKTCFVGFSVTRPTILADLKVKHKKYPPGGRSKVLPGWNGQA